MAATWQRRGSKIRPVLPTTWTMLTGSVSPADLRSPSAAVGSSDASDFHSLISLFNLAVTLSDTGLSSDNRFEFSGIDLHGEQNDNRGTILDGPVTVTPWS